MIDIVLSERDFDYELQALVTGFFPGVHNRVLIQPEQEDAALFELAERESGDGISLLTGVFLGQYEIRGWVLGKGHLHRNSVSVSGGHPTKINLKNFYLNYTAAFRRRNCRRGYSEVFPYGEL